MEIWDVSILVNKQYKGIVEPGCSEGYMEIEEHPGDVTDAAFSPDATVIATACSDGCVKFFQVGTYFCSLWFEITAVCISAIDISR